MTKTVKFNENGQRTEFEIQIFELNTQGPVIIATWNTGDGIKQSPSIRAIPVVADSAAMSLRNRTFIVLTALVRLCLFFSLILYLCNIFIC